MSTNPIIQAEIAVKTDNLYAGLQKAAQGFNQFGKNIESQMGGLGKVIGNIKGPLVALGAAIGGMAWMKKAADDTVAWVKESQKLALVLGITAEKASVLKLAIGDIYGTDEEYLGMVGKVTKSLNSNEEAFKKLGVQTRDSQGNFRNTTDIILDTNTALSKIQSGTDRNIAGLQVYGKSWMDASKYVALTAEVMAAAEEKAHRLNLAVGPEAEANVNAYRASMNDVEDVVQGLQMTLGQELLPSLTELGIWFAEIGPPLVKAFSVTIKSLITAWHTLVFVIKSVAITVASVVNIMIDGLTSGFGIIKKAMSGDFKGAWEDAKRYPGEIAASFKNNFGIIADEYEKLGEKLGNTWDGRGARAADPNTGSKTKTSSDDDKKAKEARRKAEQDEYAWQLSELKKREDLLKKQVEQEEKVYDIWAKSKLDFMLTSIDIEELQANESFNNYEISSTELLAQQRIFEEKRYALKNQALQDRLALDNLEASERARIEAEQDALSNQRRLKNMELDILERQQANQNNGSAGFFAGLDQMFNEGKNKFDQFKNVATSVASSIQNTFATSITSIMTGQMKLGNALKSIWTSIKSIMVKAVSDIIAAKIKEWAVDKAIAIWKSMNTKKEVVENTTKQASNTGAAASGIFQAHSGIPFVGVALAIGFVALMMAMMSKFTARAVGGLVSKPEYTLLGEAGPEIVAPESSFKDYINTLTNTIHSDIEQRNAKSAANLRLASESMAVQSQSNASSNGNAGSNVNQITLSGNYFIGSGKEGMDSAAKAINDLITHHDQYFG